MNLIWNTTHKLFWLVLKWNMHFFHFIIKHVTTLSKMKYFVNILILCMVTALDVLENQKYFFLRLQVRNWYFSESGWKVIRIKSSNRLMEFLNDSSISTFSIKCDVGKYLMERYFEWINEITYFFHIWFCIFDNCFADTASSRKWMIQKYIYFF